MALSSEEQAAIHNIMSLIQQLLQMEQGTNAVSEGNLEPVEKKEETGNMEDDKKKPEEIEEEKKEEEVLMKALRRLVKKADADASTGNDDAEEKIDDIPEIDEDNIDEVTKAIMAFAKRGKKVNKSTSGTARLEKAIADLTTVMKSVVEDQQEIGSALTNLLDAQGVLDEVKKSMGRGTEVNQVKKSVNSGKFRPALERDVVRKALREELTSIFKGTPAEVEEDDDEGITQVNKTDRTRKGLASVLKSLVG